MKTMKPKKEAKDYKIGIKINLTISKEVSMIPMMNPRRMLVEVKHYFLYFSLANLDDLNKEEDIEVEKKEGEIEVETKKEKVD